MSKRPLRERFIRGGKFQQEQENILLKLVEGNKKDALEVGCGKGYFSYILAKQKKISRIYGVDVYKDFQIKEIERYANKTSYKGINKDNVIPYEDNSFDLVFSMDVIEHVDDDIKFIKEHIRVCKPGGKIIVGTPNFYRLTNLPLIWTGMLKFPRDMGSDTYGKCLHLREYKYQDLKKILSINSIESQISDVKIKPCWWGVLPLNVGTSIMPKIFNEFCQFWFVTFTKI